MPALTTPPNAPSTSDPTNFATKADALVAWFATNVGEMNAFQAALTALAAGTAFTLPYTVSSTTADADPGAGLLRLDNFAAQTSATALRLDLVDAAGATQTTIIDSFAASSSAVKGQFRLVKLGDPAVWLAGNITAVASPAGYRNVTVSGLSGSSAAPFAAGDDVVLLFTRSGDKGEQGTASAITRVERTSNTILGSSDSAKFIDITSGTFSQTFAACATLSAGWWCYIRNAGTGDITLDPSGSETIDGLASFVMYPGEVRWVHCDGAALRSVVVTAFSRTFTASGTFTKPPGYTRFAGLLWGGGGSGAKSGAGAGGGGACVPFALTASALAATETITIAAPAAGPTSNGNGVAGNNSTLGSLVTAYGGAAGTTAKTGGGGGGTLSAGSGQVGGGPLGSSAAASNSGFGGAGGGANSGAGPGGAAAYGGGGGAGDGGVGGASVFGGGGGGGGAASPGAGGASVFGGAGGAGADSTSGTDGTAPGGGGGGTLTGTKAGDGARGELRIWGIA